MQLPRHGVEDEGDTGVRALRRGAREVLVDGLEPADVVVRVWHEVDRQLDVLVLPLREHWLLARLCRIRDLLALLVDAALCVQPLLGRVDLDLALDEGAQQRLLVLREGWPREHVRIDIVLPPVHLWVIALVACDLVVLRRGGRFLVPGLHSRRVRLADERVLFREHELCRLGHL